MYKILFLISYKSSKPKEVKQTRQTTISAPDYGTASKNLEKANQALKAGNYADAIKYANRANQSISTPK